MHQKLTSKQKKYIAFVVVCNNTHSSTNYSKLSLNESPSCIPQITCNLISEKWVVVAIKHKWEMISISSCNESSSCFLKVEDHDV